MRDSFGARVRRHREERGVSLTAVAEQTKIKASLLEGLERDDISQWPAGIFRRAYVRAYAAAIGFDPDTALREFLALHPEPVDAPDPPQPAPARLRTFVGSRLGSLLRRSSAPSAPSPSSSPPSGATATVGKHESPAPLGLAISPVERPVSAPASPAAAPPAPPQPAAAAAARPTPDEGQRTADLLAAARICTDLGRVQDIKQVPPLLREAAKVLGARGLIVWVWDAAADELKPALVHGYPAKVRARLRGVSADADNVTAAAFRAAAPLARSGALAIPLLAPSACAGVLAVELPDGTEQDAGVRALATFFAAILAQLVGVSASDSHDVVDAAARPSIEAQPG